MHFVSRFRLWPLLVFLVVAVSAGVKAGVAQEEEHEHVRRLHGAWVMDVEKTIAQSDETGEEPEFPEDIEIRMVFGDDGDFELLADGIPLHEENLTFELEAKVVEGKNQLNLEVFGAADEMTAVVTFIDKNTIKIDPSVGHPAIFLRDDPKHDLFGEWKVDVARSIELMEPGHEFLRELEPGSFEGPEIIFEFGADGAFQTWVRGDSGYPPGMTYEAVPGDDVEDVLELSIRNRKGVEDESLRATLTLLDENTIEYEGGGGETLVLVRLVTWETGEELGSFLSGSWNADRDATIAWLKKYRFPVPFKVEEVGEVWRFQEDGRLEISQGDEVDNGNWEIDANDEGRLVLLGTFPNTEVEIMVESEEENSMTLRFDNGIQHVFRRQNNQ